VKATGTTERSRAVGYTRVSTESQVSEGESLKTQQTQIEAHAAAKGWELVRIYSDEGISGSKAENRPALNELMNDCRTGSYQYAIIARLSRFARNTHDFLEYSDRLKKYGVNVVSIAENIDPSTHTGKLMMTLIAAIAEWERESIREQMATNKFARWSQHRTFIGKPPFGYRWNKKTNQLEIDEQEAEVYRRIVKMYVDQGLSYRDIQIQLTSEGIRCKKAWFSNTTISYILKNSCYYGHYVVNTRIYDYDKDEEGRHVSTKAKRTKELKPAKEHIEFPIPHLISKPEWDRIQARTEFNKVKSKRTTWSNNYWLRDVIHCFRCGGKMHPHMGSVRRDGTYPRYYCCYWASTSTKSLAAAQRERCTLPYIPADILEKAVWDTLLGMLRHPYHRKRHIAPLADLHDQYDEQIQTMETELANLEREHKQVQKARQRLFNLYELEKIDESEISERLSGNRQKILEIEGRIGEAIRRIDDLRFALENDKVAAEFVKNRRGAIKRMLEELEQLSSADRKRVIESLLDGPIGIFDAPEKDFIPDEELTKLPPFYDARFRFNREIFQWLLTERKISPIDPDEPDDNPPKGKGNQKNKKERLDNNGPDHPAAADLCRSVGNIQDIQRGRVAPGPATALAASVSHAAPYGLGRRAGWRRSGAATG
jgi:site-specific DNA recombinase